MTTTKMIEYLRTERITPEGMMGEGTGDGVDDVALLDPSSCRRAQRIREMGIIGKDGQEFRPQRDGGVVPAEAAAGDPPLCVDAPAQGLGEQDPKTHTPPPLWRGG